MLRQFLRKPEGYRTVFKIDLTDSRVFIRFNVTFLKIGAKEIARLPGNVRPLSRAIKSTASFTSQTLYKKTDDDSESTFVTSLAQANNYAESQGFTEDSRPPGEKTGEFKFYLNKETGEQVLLSNKEVADMSKTQRDNLSAVPKETTRGQMQTVTFRTPQVIATTVRPAGTTFMMYDSEIEAWKKYQKLKTR